MTAMTEKQAFRYGFIYRCTEEGCDDGEVDRRARLGLEKSAEGGFLQSLGGAVAGVGLLPLVGAAGIGAAGGIGLAKMQEPEIDPEEIRQQELIQAYNTHAQHAKLRDLARRFRPPERPSFARI